MRRQSNFDHWVNTSLILKLKITQVSEMISIIRKELLEKINYYGTDFLSKNNGERALKNILIRVTELSGSYKSTLFTER